MLYEGRAWTPAAERTAELLRQSNETGAVFYVSRTICRPLRTIANNVQLLERRYQGSTGVPRNLPVFVGNVDGWRHLTERLLDYAIAHPSNRSAHGIHGCS